MGLLALLQPVTDHTRTILWFSGLLALALLSGLAALRASTTWLQDTAQATVSQASTALTVNLANSLPDSTSQPLNQLPATAPVSSNGPAANTSTTQTSVTVNGQSIPLPDNGSVHMTVPGGNNSQTNVDITVENQHTSSRSRSSLRVQTKSSSSSSSSTSTHIRGDANIEH
jgi:hypothetical protein